MQDLFSLKYVVVLNLEQYHYCRANIKLNSLELRWIVSYYDTKALLMSKKNA